MDSDLAIVVSCSSMGFLTVRTEGRLISPTGTVVASGGLPMTGDVAPCAWNA